MEDARRSWDWHLTTYIQTKVQGGAGAKDLENIAIEPAAAHVALSNQGEVMGFPCSSKTKRVWPAFL